MTSQELAARAHDLVAAWNAHDVDRIAAAHCVDVRLRDGGQTLVGRGAIRDDAERVLAAIPDLELEPRRSLVAGHAVTLEWTARGAGLERHGVTVADYDATGRVCALTRYWARAARA